MSPKTLKYASSLLILPVLYVLFSALNVWTQGQPIDPGLPRWDRLLILITVVALERLYKYRYAVSQRYVLTRDIIANIVNLYITGAVAAVIFLPILGYFLGRKTLIARTFGPVLAPDRRDHGDREPLALLDASLAAQQ
jgi:hypothetical protein